MHPCELEPFAIRASSAPTLIETLEDADDSSARTKVTSASASLMMTCHGPSSAIRPANSIGSSLGPTAMAASSSPAKTMPALARMAPSRPPRLFFTPQCRTVVQFEKHQHSSGIAVQVLLRNMAESCEVSNLEFLLVCGMEHGIDGGFTASKHA